jgi:ABC-2 type transport system ATP-binding protein
MGYREGTSALRRRDHPEMAIPTAFVTVHGLTFDYDTKRAIDGVSFAIDAGSVTALVGPNGAGKTTLLRCLAGLEQPVAGAIRIDGLDVLAAPRAAHRKLGFLQDFFGVYDALTVERNLLYAAAAQGVPADSLVSSVTRAAEAVGIADRLGQLVGELSRGLRQRLAIARTLVHQPALLLLDEPAAGLDPEARMELSGLIRSLSASGMTLIISSHILSELEQYSTHMLAMRAGQIAGPHPIGGARPGLERLKVAFSGAAAAIVAFLETQADISSVRDEADGVTFDFAGDEEARRQLLRAMIEAGLPVMSFAVAGADLERMYRAGEAT